MAIDKLQFTKDWNSSTDFPTVETDEAAVRHDMQFLHDETKNYLNGKVTPAIDSVRNDLDAAVKVQDETKHTHGNKALLDTYTQTEADLKKAVEETHEHENKDVLDSIAGVTQSLGDAADKVPSEAAVSKAIALAGGIPGGGVTGQVLVKASDESMDTQWDTLTPARVGAVKKSGDTMTGTLFIRRPYPSVDLQDTDSGSDAVLQHTDHRTYLGTRNEGTDANRRLFTVRDSTDRAPVNQALELIDTVDGVSQYYAIYGEHNKPAPKDIGALSLDGSTTMTGNLSIKKAPGVTLILEDSTNNTRGVMQMWANTLALQSQNVAGDGTNMRQLSISNSKGRALKNALQLLDMVNGTQTNYNVLHTGNLTDHGIGRVGQIEYVGTVESAREDNENRTYSVTLDFVPKLAILEVVNTLDGDFLSKIGPVFITGVGQFYYRDKFGTYKDDTYTEYAILKVTEFGTTLSWTYRKDDTKFCDTDYTYRITYFG